MGRSFKIFAAKTHRKRAKMTIKKETIDSDITLRSSLPDSDTDEMADISNSRTTTPEPSAAVQTRSKGPIGMGPKPSQKMSGPAPKKMKKRSKSSKKHNKHSKKQ